MSKEREELKQKAEQDSERSKAMLKELFTNFGDVIPNAEKVNLSAANLAYMASVILDYSELKLKLLQMLEGEAINYDNELKLEGVNLDIYKLALNTVLDFVDSEDEILLPIKE